MSTKEALSMQSVKNLKGNSVANTNTPSVKTHSGPKTRITLNYDVGFSNTLYVRGQGANLSWEKGIMLKNIKADEWVWETNVPFTSCEFKVLINDSIYETGQNHTLTCGASIRYTPKFN